MYLMMCTFVLILYLQVYIYIQGKGRNVAEDLMYEYYLIVE